MSACNTIKTCVTSPILISIQGIIKYNYDQVLRVNYARQCKDHKLGTRSQPQIGKKSTSYDLKCITFQCINCQSPVQSSPKFVQSLLIPPIPGLWTKVAWPPRRRLLRRSTPTTMRTAAPSPGTPSPMVRSACMRCYDLKISGCIKNEFSNKMRTVPY